MISDIDYSHYVPRLLSRDMDDELVPLYHGTDLQATGDSRMQTK